MILKSYKILKDKHKNKPMFIFGAGTSLYKMSQDPIMEEFYKYPCITVNSSIILFDWTRKYWDDKYWESNDSATRLFNYWDNVKKSKCLKIIRNSWEKYFDQLDDNFLVFSPREDQKNIKKEDEGLCSTTSIPTAIDLSIFMGCNKIFLMGVDQYFKGRYSHFWQFFPKDKQVTTTQHFAPLPLQNKMFKENNEAYIYIAEYAKRENVKIYNCNKLSQINSFEKINYKEIFEKL